MAVNVFSEHTEGSDILISHTTAVAMNPPDRLTQVLGRNTRRIFLSVRIETLTIPEAGNWYLGGPPGSGMIFPARSELPVLDDNTLFELHLVSFGKAICGSVWVDISPGDDIVISATEVSCSCPDNIPIGCECGVNYSFSNASAILPAFGAPGVLLFGGNKNRLSITLSCGDSTAQSVVGIAITPATSLSGYIFEVSSPFNIVLPFRDWGPVIREPIYLFSTPPNVGKTVYGVEINLVPKT
jgi:hypothetical protein